MSAEDPSDTQDARPEDEGTVRYLPTAGDEDFLRFNRGREDWLSRDGAQDRSFKETSWRKRTADTRASRTDLDATPMRWSENARKLGHQTNYVVDGAKARVILSMLVTPGEVSRPAGGPGCHRPAVAGPAGGRAGRLQPHLAVGIGLGATVDQLRDATFNEVLGKLHEQTNLTYKDSFLYAKDEQLFRSLGV